MLSHVQALARFVSESLRHRSSRIGILVRDCRSMGIRVEASTSTLYIANNIAAEKVWCVTSLRMWLHWVWAHESTALPPKASRRQQNNVAGNDAKGPTPVRGGTGLLLLDMGDVPIS